MKLGMSSLDIMVCARELKNAIGARVDNVYELDGVFLLRLRMHGGYQDLLLEPGLRVHLTGMRYEVPKMPSPYAMLLRKYLENARLVAIDQPDFERILKFKFSREEERILILELFGRGNFILCDDQLEIIQPYRAESWKHRVLRAGEKYVCPPKRGVNIRELDVKGLHHALEGAPDVVRALAINLSLGGSLAEEVCTRAAVPKDSKPIELSERELEAVLKSIRDLFTQELAPNIVYDDGKPIDVLPHDFKIHLGKRVKRFDSFSEALDEYFSTLAVSKAAEKRKKDFERKLKRLRDRLDEQEKHFADLQAKSREAKLKADLVTTHHTQINEALSRLLEIKSSQGWQAAINALENAKKSGKAWARVVKRIDASTMEAELALSGQSVTFDLKLSVFENASQLYERYKKLAEKAAGAKEALERTKRELDKLAIAGAPELEVPTLRKRRKPKWFEHFRWFISSDGMLVIAGRDVRTNQEVVEKYMESGDRYLHADIVGAPHVVIKAAGKEVPEKTISEAAQFAAMHSRAWREGLGELDVYWVTPEQVSRRVPPGTYLPKGSYMIVGKRNYVKVPIEAAVGSVVIDGERVVSCGPRSAIEKHSRAIIRVVPGRMKKSELAREIKTRLKVVGIDVSTDEIERAIPPGKGDIKRV